MKRYAPGVVEGGGGEAGEQEGDDGGKATTPKPQNDEIAGLVLRSNCTQLNVEKNSKWYGLESDFQSKKSLKSW